MLTPKDIVTQLINDAGLTQDVIEQLTGVGQTTVSRIYRGITKKPNWEYVRALEALHAHIFSDGQDLDTFKTPLLSEEA